MTQEPSAVVCKPDAISVHRKQLGQRIRENWQYFYMEDRAIERLTDSSEFWMPFVDDTITYPIDCVFTAEELETIDRYRADFESAVSEQEGLWLKDGGPTDDEWNAYVEMLSKSCGMDKPLEAYQTAYDRYKANA